ncbi:alpha-glucosidase/alpha-galactosidase [Treponema parvum]|uniref:family 4 glycosyl hydrolase n=1 Tax=Treponema parvum TaxID=138851 RepID=UPI001AEC4D21|nr:alpha-glucosidase/alpha-galactosidase [Treponema parvum]QTQ16221.1 alpha-glucosidase/alpha-galactosidase [Treponema parvum]
MRDLHSIKIAYIGGGSKQWARVFMNDLALAKDILGEIALFDIDVESAERNKKIGERINQSEKTVSKWKYSVYKRIDGALKNADFVVISILPGTFEEMRSDVHAPEKYGIYQPVGDTCGPGAVLRNMRTIPVYEEFAKKIMTYCPDAWVINFTNPMSLCVKTLYDVFPKIKAFGCCHEVFHTQKFLCCVAHEILGIPQPQRNEIYTDVSGINHFTWITEAYYKDINLMSLLPQFIKKYFDSGYYEEGDADKYKTNMFAYANRVKMDMFNRYNVLGAAGDRHLVEFMNNGWYLENPKAVEFWKFRLTTVDFRVKQQKERIEETIAMAEGKKPVTVKKSSEEAVELIKALLGLETRVSNVNMPNKGQMPDYPMGAVVETNCVFSNNYVAPVTAKPLPDGPKALVMRNLINNEVLYEGVKNRDLDMIFESFINQPLCSKLNISDARELFKTMIDNTASYLPEKLRHWA